MKTIIELYEVTANLEYHVRFLKEIVDMNMNAFQIGEIDDGMASAFIFNKVGPIQSKYLVETKIFEQYENSSANVMIDGKLYSVYESYMDKERGVNVIVVHYQWKKVECSIHSWEKATADVKRSIKTYLEGKMRTKTA